MKIRGFLFILLSLISTAEAQPGDFSISIMGPLLIGDPLQPESESSKIEWSRFENNLLKVKALGVSAVSTDIWWGLVQKQEHQFDWRYYDKMVDIIERVGLRWVPILSFHQLGGNVGDTGYIPLPDWIWQKHRGSSEHLTYKSEQGHVSREVISAWATRDVLVDYERFMVAFKNHYASKKNLISEVNISLGPAGELRFPSYNSHDIGSGYPSRGALQAYSEPALESFRSAMLSKYGSLSGINRAWGFQLRNLSDVAPPRPEFLNSTFFQNGEHFSNYGKDFFDWYNRSLLEHGRLLLTTAQTVFAGTNSAFRGIDLGAKVPGVHWRVYSDRLAELSAGLIRTSYGDWFSPDSGRGYAETLKMFADVQEQNKTSKIVVHFTAIELNDGKDGPQTASGAKSLAFWIGDEARKLGLTLKGENALAGELHGKQAWDNILNVLKWSHYSGVTLLRLEAVAENADTLVWLGELSAAHAPRCGSLFSR